MKAKIHAVKIDGKVMLMRAKTRQGAKREAVAQIMRDASVDVATEDQIYAAGKAGAPIYGDDEAEAGGEVAPT